MQKYYGQNFEQTSANPVDPDSETDPSPICCANLYACGGLRIRWLRERRPAAATYVPITFPYQAVPVAIK